MVRETRHLWVGNLPDNIREERIREHFKRYGRVQSVKLLPRGGSGGGGAAEAAGGACAAVAFMDIKSASKAHNSEKLLDERAYTTEYYEPAAIPAPATASAGSSPAGSSGGSVSSAPRYQHVVSSAVAEEGGSVAAAVGSAALAGGAAAAAAGAAAGSVAPWRGTNDSADRDRDHYRRAGGGGGGGTTPVYCASSQHQHYRRAYLPPTISPGALDRTPHHRWYGSGGGETSAPSTPGGAAEGGAGGGGGGGGGSTDGARRRRRSGSGLASPPPPASSRSSSSSEPSSDSRPSTPGALSSHRHHRPDQWSSTSGRPLAICVRNLPARSSDSSLKDGLYHEYKKHGKVAWVKVVGASAERYAVVRFKKPSDVEKALEVSQDKLFFGCRIAVAPHQGAGADLDDGEPARPYETDLDENHPKATRTLFIGNLEKDVTLQQLREKFKHFGRIVEIDVKKQSGGAGYAFCQYASISSVVDAIRAMDGEYVGSSRVKLGFGKSMATTCVWIDGLTEHTEKQVLGVVSRCGTATSVCVDRSAGAALVHFEQAAAAASAVRELRRVAAALAPPPAAAAALPPLPAALAAASTPAAGAAAAASGADADQRRLMVDFASRDCQEAFYEQFEKHGGNGAAALAAAERLPGDVVPRYARHDSLSRYEVGGVGSCRSRATSYNRSASRTPRYAISDHYDVADYAPDRRYRVYDEFGSSSPADAEALAAASAGAAVAAGAVPHEEARAPHAAAASPRRRLTRHHRRRSRDSTPDHNAKLRKERRRSGGGRSEVEWRQRSRSGSRRRRTSEAERRRHRRRREHSGASSRAGTPLCDELPDGPAPAEPRRPPAPRDRSHPPMTLPLPKFAEQVLRSGAVVAAPPAPAPAAPASPPRAPSASSSSGGSAPHSPSLEERIRNLDEKYEKWSGSRAAAAEAAERGRLRHRLLDIDIKEVKPSEVVRSLLAKRSVFDEDSERLEGSAALDKCPSSPRAREPRVAPRALQYPFPTHPPPPPTPASLVPPSEDAATSVLRDARQMTIEAVKSEFKKSFVECSDASAERDNLRTVIDSSDTCSSRPDGPRPNRTDRSSNERQYKLTEIDMKFDILKSDSGIQRRSSSTDKSHPELLDRTISDKTDRDRTDHDRDPRREADRRRIDLSWSKESDDKIPNKDNGKDSRANKCFSEDVKICGKSEMSNYEKISSDIREQLEIDSMETLEEDCSLKVERHIEEQLQQEKDSKLGELSKTKRTVKRDPEENCISELKTNQEQEKGVSTFDKVDKVNIEKQRIEKDQTIQEITENNTVEIEKSEFERINCEQAEKERNDRLKTEAEKHERDRLAKEKIEKENFEREKSERERKEKERIEKERAERDRVEKEKAERVKLDNEKLKKEREAAEREKQKSELERTRVAKENKLKEDAEVARIEVDKLDKEKQEKERFEKERTKSEREQDRLEKDKNERELDREKPNEEKHIRYDTKKEKTSKDKRKEDHMEVDIFNHYSKPRRDEKHKHDRHRKDHSDSRRDQKKETEPKPKDISRKSSRDESTREMQRKDSSDSTASRASHDSAKFKDCESTELKDISKHSARHKHSHEYNHKHKSEKEISPRNAEIRKNDHEKNNHERSKESKTHSDYISKDKPDGHNDKPRHYLLDSQNLEIKRKERLNSSSSLPSNIGLKRRMSSQDILDALVEDSKKAKMESNIPERRDSKDCKPAEKSKAFNKGHVAKLLESKIKDDKKNQVKPPDDKFEDSMDLMNKDQKVSYADKNKMAKKSPKNIHDEKSLTPPVETKTDSDSKSDVVSPRDIEFLATLELRSSEEDEKQKALRKEMKEKKRIQQLQQIQELQLQHDALQQSDINKIKDEKRFKNEDRKKEAAREKRMSIERKSREDGSKSDSKRRSHKPGNSSDTSDSDEPKKHSIFDIVDDGPTYISMYDKVKARSCKNMQKQEEEKRQEKIKAKFCQLKQSRAKREEKKRSTSWDEDSDTDHDPKKYSHKHSVGSSSEDDSSRQRRENITDSENDYEAIAKMEKLHFYNDSTNDEDARNKLSRKNSRSRIMSDTSDDDSIKRNLNANVENHVGVKKEIFSDNEMQSTDYYIKKEREIKKEPCRNSIKKEVDDKLTKQAMIDMFSDKFVNLDEKKILRNELMGDMKPSVDIVKLENDFKCSQIKVLCNDFSSEGELSSKFSGTEVKKKHKKKQKKQKSSLSEEDTKSTDYSEQSPILGGEVKHRHNSEKTRKHNNKKDKRKEKNRDSLDGEDYRDDKVKARKGKKCFGIGYDNKVDSGSSAIRRDEKMENIFGPLSDDSDTGPRTSDSNNQHNNFGLSDLSSSVTASINEKFDYITKNVNDFMLKDKEREESRRRKERKRKEKRYFARDDDNSLDVDAAGKAIEASLFADSVPENDNQNTKIDSVENSTIKSEQDVFRLVEGDEGLETPLINNELKQVEKVRKEAKEKKKKKKKSKEERQNRHHHYESNDKVDKSVNESNVQPIKEINIMNKDAPKDHYINKEECKPALQSPSLPRLTDSPPLNLYENPENSESVHSSRKKDDELPAATDNFMEVKVNISTEATNEHQIHDVLPLSIQTPELRKNQEKFIPGFGGNVDQNMSENAVKSIAEFEKPKDKIVENKPLDPNTVQNKVDEKLEEKPRAVISQEETEDAVAALLGESFGGNGESFGNCFDKDEDISSAQVASTSMESENIPEEDAEVTQAVQNLNASELEIKPDTPMSENDLQIDTDTEEQEDSQNEILEKLPITSQNHKVSITTAAVTECKVKILQAAPTSSALLNITSPGNLNTDIAKAFEPQPHASFGRFNDLANIKSDQTRTDVTFAPIKREIFHQITSTATPVISTAWTLAGNKSREPHLLNVHANHVGKRDEKSIPMTANIVHLKSPMSQSITLNTQHRPLVGTQARINHSFVINQMRPGHVTNIQPPTIKIPEPHIMYQKQSGVVISPRVVNEVRLQSPKSTPHPDISSPRMTILSPSPQNMNSMGLASPTLLQQRSPGHVKMVRMQQPPLSPIQTMPLQHGNRTVVSPNRPTSVLVQTQNPPMHVNRLPVTPVLAPLSKPLHSNNMLHHQKGITVNTNSAILHPHKIVSEIRKTDPRTVQDLMDASKLVISPSNLQPSTNPTVMAQNRLIMQNAGLHMSNKILFSTAGQLSERRDLNNLQYKSDISKTETVNKSIYGQSPIIHIATMNQSTSPMVHTMPKPVISVGQEQYNTTRPHITNVIHSLNSQRLLTTVAMTSVIQGDPNKLQQSSVLSMAPLRSPGLVTRFEKPAHVSVTSSVLNNVVMTPLMVKTNASHNNIPNNIIKEDVLPSISPKLEEKTTQQSIIPPVRPIMDLPKDIVNKQASIPAAAAVDMANKCETDFEELLKDTTNEIKVTKDSDRKIEVNVTVGESITSYSTSQEMKIKIEDKNHSQNMTLDKTEENNPNIITDTIQPDVKSESDTIKSDESVIKKVDDLCNKKEVNDNKPAESVSSQPGPVELISADNKNVIDSSNIAPITSDADITNPIDAQTDPLADVSGSSQISPTKRGGRNARGKKYEKQQDRVQTRQISKPARGSSAARRGRGGRAKVDKKSKNMSNCGPILSGDIYDFHEDSGDETQTSSQSKNESRPRLIITIKSPGTGPTSNASAPAPTATLSIAPRDQTPAEKLTSASTYNKEEKSEDFLSPAPNTRKSRRLQEKDGNRNTVDEVIDDVIKNASLQSKVKEGNTKRTTRQAMGKTGTTDKSGMDVRKSPRGGKRTRDRSSSETSIDSSDEKNSKKDGTSPPESKVIKLTENSTISTKTEATTCVITTTIITAPATTLANNVAPAPSSIPIMKPPKKMISEISAKLASTFEVSVSRPSISVVSKEIEPSMSTIPVRKVPENSADTLSKLTPGSGRLENSTVATDVKMGQVDEKVRTTVLEPTGVELNFQRRTALPSDYVPPGRMPLSVEVLPPGRAALSGEIPPSSRILMSGDAVLSRSLLPTEVIPPARTLMAGEPGRLLMSGAMEEADLRVQSPALPNRPPVAHRPADRGTPIVRACESEASSLAALEACRASPARAGAVGAGGAVGAVGPGARAYRAPFAPSLPRGAHHPPPPPPPPVHPALAAAAATAPTRPLHPIKHAQTGLPSRVTLTSVASVSPQGPLASDLVLSPPPAHQQTSPVTPVYYNGEGMYPHFSHQHYKVYQQHFHATQHDARATPSPYTRSLEAEGSEAPAPPLELRRAPPSARVPRPAHSPSLADRLISGRGSPPPAHGGAGASRMPSALPPPGPAGPPHASQVPREADSLQMLLRRYPVMWQGLLALKNDGAAVQMHFVHGNPGVAEHTLPRHVDGSTPPLRIAQRMRLEPVQLEAVHRKMQMENEHCMLLALPCGRDHMDVLQQSTNLTAGFITYLQRKQAAGIVNVAPPGHHQAMYTVHIFPSCDFAKENLNRIAPDLLHRVADIAHLLIVIATV